MPICQGSFSGIRPPFSAGCPILSGISSPHLCSVLPSCLSKPHGRARQPSCRSGSAAFCILNAAVFLRLHHAAGTICAEAAEAPCPIGQRNIKPTEQCILSIAQSNGRFKTELFRQKGTRNARGPAACHALAFAAAPQFWRHAPFAASPARAAAARY